MPLSSQKSDEWNEKKMVLDTMIGLNLNLVKEQYREMILVAQPAVKVYEWFYKN